MKLGSQETVACYVRAKTFTEAVSSVMVAIPHCSHMVQDDCNNPVLLLIYNGQLTLTVQCIRIYSETSDKGDSERAPNKGQVLLYTALSIENHIALKETSLQRIKWLVPRGLNCSYKSQNLAGTGRVNVCIRTNCV